MATCDVQNDAPSQDNILESEDEKEIPINVNDVEIFQKDVFDLNVIDVYNIAASVGREFEKLTDAFGGAIFSDVMPKIIRVLEMLEAFASRSQSYSTDVVELQAAVQKLQIDNKASLEKHKEDLEMVETAWQEETRQLLQSVETLQEDNRRLTQLLTDKTETQSNSRNNEVTEKSVLSILNESVEKQRDELREKNGLLQQQSSECEALSAQAEQLAKLNVKLRRKIGLMEQQAASIADQNTDVETTCKEKDRQIKELQKRLAEVTPKPIPVTAETESTTTSSSTDTHEALVDPLLANKLVIDLTDPDRPRYTLDELRDVLNERNKLKLKCFLQEDELKYYKQKEESWEEIDAGEISEAKQQHERNNNRTTEQKQESKIKKLFSSIFSREAKSTPIPHVPRKSRHSHHVKFDIPLIDDCEEVHENIPEQSLTNEDTPPTRTDSFCNVDLNVPELKVSESHAVVL